MSKADKWFKASIITCLSALFGIFIGYLISLMYPAFGTWFAFGCFIVLCAGLILSITALLIYVFE